MTTIKRNNCTENIIIKKTNLKVIQLICYKDYFHIPLPNHAVIKYYSILLNSIVYNKI